MDAARLPNHRHHRYSHARMRRDRCCHFHLQPRFHQTPHSCQQKRMPKTLALFARALPAFVCGSAEIGEMRRLNCRAPYSCCCPPPRYEDECNEFGSPLSRASPLSLGTTVSQEGTPQSSDTPYEVAPPTPGTNVTKDPNHSWAGTPRRTNPNTCTPSGDDKISGNRADNPHFVG